ncbi:hypothetical protein [Flavisolibacter nicotianae]|uniref:hypothetical protein n=1 Tax=Flavisolibacter nicotianae TaxID=2364882 RepID=UPI000EB3B596|nr:hypothetical protein [Flavisolibacter nicotianae]
MTPRLFVALCFGFVFTTTSCNVLKDSPKYGFSEGYYQSRIFHKKKKKVYVVPQDDSVKVYTAKSLQKQFVDTTSSLKIAFPPNQKPLQFEDYFFRKATFDIDVLTIPFKYRPAVARFPRQLNATFNGALYAGFRSDLYRLSYSQTPLRLFKRRITHFGYSFGAIGGIGTSRIDEYVTNNNISIQYDGTVAFAGLNLLVGVETISIGLAVGADHLLDPNRKYWVNQGKPWFGVSFGLNLN